MLGSTRTVAELRIGKILDQQLQNLNILLPQIHNFPFRPFILIFLSKEIYKIVQIISPSIQGGALNRGLFFADPPPSPLGAVSGKISEIR